jgi:hypothetical protein
MQSEKPGMRAYPDLGDKVVLVTGAGRGLGRAIARAFAAQGARVAANDLTPVNLDDTLALIEAEGGQATGFLADVSRKMEVQALLAQVAEAYGSIDVLVNNAGVVPRIDLLSMDEWDWDRTLAVNLKGPFLLTQAAGRRMADAGGGVIVNVASAHAAEGTLARAGAYLASKAGLLALTRQSALELAEHGIRVNAVCPAHFTADPIPGTAQGEPGRVFSESEEDEIRVTIARVVLFLCSSRANFLTGETVVVDPERGLSSRASQDETKEGA